MDRWAFFTAAILLFASLSPGALSVNPFDNDADTGGDASDLILHPTMLEPGDHEGRLTNPYDVVDSYGFQAHTGDVAQINLSFPAEENLEVLLHPPDYSFAFVFHSPGEYGIVLPHDGVWTLEFFLEPGHQIHEVHYSFGFHLKVLPHTLVFDERVAWSTFEARLDEPGEVYYTVMATMEFVPWVSEPRAHLLARDFFIERDGGEWLDVQHMRLRTPWATGTEIHLEPSPVPSVQAPPLAEVPYNGALMSYTFGAEMDRGHMRVSSIASDPGSDVRLVVASSRPLEWAREKGDEGVHHWTTLNSGADEALIVPGYSQVGPRSYEFSAGPRFMGWLAANGAEAHATAPDGTAYTPCPPPFDWTIFQHTRHLGNWELHLGETESFGNDATHTYFLGFDFPELGIAPPIRNPYPEHEVELGC